MSLQVTNYASVEPVTLDEIKEHLVIDYENTDHDAVLEAQIKAARTYCEQYLGGPIVRTTFAYKINSFPSAEIELPISPLISIDSITYIDTAQSPNLQTLATTVYDIDKGVRPAVLFLKYGQSWPSVRGGRNDVVITLIGGYSDSVSSPRDYDDQVPEAIKSALKMVVGDLFLNRERKMDIQTYHNDTAEMMLDFYRSRSTTCAV